MSGPARVGECLGTILMPLAAGAAPFTGKLRYG